MGPWLLKFINFLCLAMGIGVSPVGGDIPRDRHDPDPVHHPAQPPMTAPAILTGWVVAIVFGLALVLALFRLLTRMARREDHR